MCVPLMNGAGDPIGAIQLDTQNRSKKFSTDDLNLLTIVANLASVAVEKARMHAAEMAREKEQKEIELARTVLLGFLPQTLPAMPGYEFFSHYSPAQTVGGDYYDFVSLPGGRNRGRAWRRGRQGRARGTSRGEAEFRSEVLAVHRAEPGEGDQHVERSDD